MSPEEYRERINAAVANAYALGHANGVLGVGFSTPAEVTFAFGNYWTQLYFNLVKVALS